MDSGTSELSQKQAQSARIGTTDAEGTRQLGFALGRRLCPGDCLSLRGGLGSGKTTLTQGIVAGAGGGSDVRSPTFLLHAVHPGRITVHHLDLYRLPAPADLQSLGLDELLEDGAAVVEWAERASPRWFNGDILISVGKDLGRQIDLVLPAHLREAIG